VVAVGNLDRIWPAFLEDVADEAWETAFRGRFGAAWTDVLDAADPSLSYNASSDVYFSVRDAHRVEDLTVEQLLEKEAAGRPLDIIVS